MSLPQLSDLRAWVGIADAADDTRLNDALNSAIAQVDELCGQTFTLAATATTRIFAPCDAGLLVLPDHSPIGSTAGLVVKIGPGDGTFPTTIAAANYQTEPLNALAIGEPITRIRLISGTFTTGHAATVEVTARWGWPDVPEPVREAVLILAAEGWKLKDAPLGVAGFGEFGAIRIRENAAVMQRLARYRRGSAIVGIG